MKHDTKLLVADDWSDYALLDCGDGMKLERFGTQRVIRPDPQAFWTPAAPTQSWQADARFASKSETRFGIWVCFRNIRYIGGSHRRKSAPPVARSKCSTCLAIPA